MNFKFVSKIDLEKIGLDEDEQAIMVVSRVSKYPLDENDKWSTDSNKSFPREGLVCCECKEPVVMSNGLYEVYQKNPSQAQVVCLQCSVDLTKKLIAE